MGRFTATEALDGDVGTLSMRDLRVILARHGLDIEDLSDMVDEIPEAFEVRVGGPRVRADLCFMFLGY